MRKPKPTPDSQWDDIPGFNQKTGQYVPLDTEAWFRDHKIREIAAERGLKNQPSENEKQPDDMHERIKSWVHNRGLQCKRDVDHYISDANAELNDIEDNEGLDQLKSRVTQIRTRVELKIKSRLQNDRNDLHDIERAVDEETRDFEEFRNQAGLNRMAVYPTGFMRKWWLVFVFAALEVAVNAFMLGEVTPTGFLGAYSQMLIITAINILIGALVIGSLLRAQNHVAIWRKILSWTLMPVVTAGILMFNLAVGHLRDSTLMIDPAQLTHPSDVLTNDVWLRLVSNPVHYESFQSGLLVIAGFVFFSIAAWKGYGADDTYPGYGKRDRHYRKLTSRYQAQCRGKIGKLQDVTEKGVDELNEMLYEMRAKQAEWRNTTDRITRVREGYPENLRQYQRNLDSLLAAYRTANRNARTETAPDFFDSPISLDPDIMEPPIFEAREEPNWQGLNEHIAESIRHIQELYKKALPEYPTLEDIHRSGKKK